ncbi:MAG: hypothetical protein VX228_03970, partial [Pseudomonadota bacterium]|nr:hypothetical protein [Pseudomonadota bacterium]
MVKVTAHTKEEAENCPVRSVLTKVTAKCNLLIFPKFLKNRLTTSEFHELKQLSKFYRQHLLLCKKLFGRAL